MLENQISKKGLPKNFNEFNRIKSIGFSDKKLSQLSGLKEKIVRRKRLALKFCQYSRKWTHVLLNLNLLHLICIQHIKETFHVKYRM